MIVGNVLHFSFSIPAGAMGLQGNPGIDGAQGPPFAQAIIEAVNTLDPGQQATCTVTFDGTNVRFTFSIPRGDKGEQGIQGPPGPPFAQCIIDSVTTLNPGETATVTQSYDGTAVRFSFGIPRGADGINGAPGEVSAAQLTSAINGTSANTNAIATLGLVVSDPPTQAEMQSIVNKLDELILNGRR